MNSIDVVFDYHERTKHQFQRYANAPGTMDWATQPNPFRWYDGAQTTNLLKKQFRDSDTPIAMTAEERAQLGDPLFELVLKDHPGDIKLDQVEQRLQADPKRRDLFVVSEDIIASQRGGSDPSWGPGKKGHRP